MTTVELIIIIVAAISVLAILGVRGGRERGTKVEHRPPPVDPKDID